MKAIKAILPFAAALLAQAVVFANPIQVYLSPADDAPVIGQLESASLATPAKWPAGSQLIEDWKPIYFRGVFEVYVHNNDIGKDLNPKPGSLYRLEPQEDAPALAISTEKDKTDIISVDTWFCQMQVETILTGYVKQEEIGGQQLATSLPQPNAAGSAAQAEETIVRELEGTLQKAGLLGRNLTGLSHRLVSDNGQTLAFVDLASLTETLQVSDFIGQKVHITGELKETESGDSLILVAETLKSGGLQ